MHWILNFLGFESKNGHVKSLFHGKTAVVDQLVFVMDVTQTLQSVQNTLVSRESKTTLRYITKITGQATLNHNVMFIICSISKYSKNQLQLYT